MKISKKVIKIIKNDLELRREIGYVLKFGDLWMSRLARDNKENGPLTTKAAIDVIKAFTGLSERTILERKVVA